MGKDTKGNELFDCVAFRIKRLGGGGKTLLEGLLPNHEHYIVLGEYETYEQAEKVFLELGRHVEAKEIPMFAVTEK